MQQLVIVILTVILVSSFAHSAPGHEKIQWQFNDPFTYESLLVSDGFDSVDLLPFEENESGTAVSEPMSIPIPVIERPTITLEPEPSPWSQNGLFISPLLSPFWEPSDEQFASRPVSPLKLSNKSLPSVSVIPSVQSNAEKLYELLHKRLPMDRNFIHSRTFEREKKTNLLQYREETLQQTIPAMGERRPELLQQILLAFLEMELERPSIIFRSGLNAQFAQQLARVSHVPELLLESHMFRFIKRNLAFPSMKIMQMYLKDWIQIAQRCYTEDCFTFQLLLNGDFVDEAPLQLSNRMSFSQLKSAIKWIMSLSPEVDDDLDADLVEPYIVSVATQILNDAASLNELGEWRWTLNLKSFMQLHILRHIQQFLIVSDAAVEIQFQGNYFSVPSALYFGHRLTLTAKPLVVAARFWREMTHESTVTSPLLIKEAVKMFCVGVDANAELIRLMLMLGDLSHPLQWRYWMQVMQNDAHGNQLFVTDAALLPYLKDAAKRAFVPGPRLLLETLHEVMNVGVNDPGFSLSQHLSVHSNGLILFQSLFHPFATKHLAEGNIDKLLLETYLDTDTLELLDFSNLPHVYRDSWWLRVTDWRVSYNPMWAKSDPYKLV